LTATFASKIIEDYIIEDMASVSRRASPYAAGKARPTVNHVIVMNYVKLNNLKISVDRSLERGATRQSGQQD
jgi:hypothetical protein